MINIPEKLAKSKKSNQIKNLSQNLQASEIWPGKKIPKKGTPFGSQKPCVGSIIGKSRCQSEKPNTISDLLIQYKNWILDHFYTNVWDENGGQQIFFKIEDVIISEPFIITT